MAKDCTLNQWFTELIWCPRYQSFGFGINQCQWWQGKCVDNKHGSIMLGKCQLKYNYFCNQWITITITCCTTGSIIIIITYKQSQLNYNYNWAEDDVMSYYLPALLYLFKPRSTKSLMLQIQSLTAGTWSLLPG